MRYIHAIDGRLLEEYQKQIWLKRYQFACQSMIGLTSSIEALEQSIDLLDTEDEEDEVIWSGDQSVRQLFNKRRQCQTNRFDDGSRASNNIRIDSVARDPRLLNRRSYYFSVIPIAAAPILNTTAIDQPLDQLHSSTETLGSTPMENLNPEITSVRERVWLVFQIKSFLYLLGCFSC